MGYDRVERPRNLKGDAVAYIAYSNICEGLFDEFYIKDLLLAVRSWVTMVDDQRGKIQGNQALAAGIPMLRFVCDVVAHPEWTDRGCLFNYIAKAEPAIDRSFRKMPFQTVESVDVLNRRVLFTMPPAFKSLSIYYLVAAFALSLTTLPFKVDLARIAPHRNDIALCLLSILHLTAIPSLTNTAEDLALPLAVRRHARLQILSVGGRYKLFARIFNSHLLEDDQHEPKPKGSFTLAVMDGPQIPPDGVIMPWKSQLIVFARRHEDGRLRLVPDPVQLDI